MLQNCTHQIRIALAKINCCKIRPWFENYDFLTFTFLPCPPKPNFIWYHQVLLYRISIYDNLNRLHWEVYINFIWSRFGIGRHILAFSINKRNQYHNMADVKHCTASPINDFEGFLHIFYCRIKNFTESLIEKLLRQVGWQGRVQNNRNSPHDARLPDCQVLTQTYSPNLFSSRFWRAMVSLTVVNIIVLLMDLGL